MITARNCASSGDLYKCGWVPMKFSKANALWRRSSMTASSKRPANNSKWKSNTNKYCLSGDNSSQGLLCVKGW